MSYEFWIGDFSIRLNHVAALKASDRIYKVLNDYYTDGTNLMEIKLLDDGVTVADIVHEKLKNDSRMLTEKERKWAEKKLEELEK